MQAILSGSLNLRQIEDLETYRNRALGISDQNARTALIKAITDQAELEHAAGKVTYETFEQGGDTYRTEMVGGRPVRTENLGPRAQGIKWFQSPDGSVSKPFSTAESPPADWQPVTDPSTEALREATTEATRTRTQQLLEDREERLTAYELEIEDPNTPSERKEVLMDYYNNNNLNYRYEEVGKTKIFKKPIYKKIYTRLSYGEIRKGYRYIGGDPRKPANWEKVKDE